MRKSIFLASLLFASNIFAQETLFDKINTIKSSTEQTLYKKALELFKNKEYQKAFDIFNTLFQTNLDDVFINYYLGRSAFEIGQYELALSAYDRILIQKPNNHRVRLELGQTYLNMGLWAQALEEFTTASEGELPKQVEQRVQKTIMLLKNKEKKSLFSVYSLFAMIYDSNINNSTKIGTFDIYSPDLNSNFTVDSNAKEESTMIYQAVASFNYKYKVNDKLIWDNNFSTVNLKYDDHKEKDVNILSFVSGPMYYTKKYKTALSVIVDKVYLGHEQHQFNYYLRPEYTRALSEKVLYQAAFKAGKINFKNNSKLDSKLLELTNNIRYLSDDYGLFNFKAITGKELEVNDNTLEVSYDYVDLQIGNSISIFDDYTLMSNISYKVSNFSDFNPTFQSRRKDKKRDYSLGIEKEIFKNTTLNLATTYTKRDSNHETAVYDKNTVKLSLYMSF